MPYIGNTIRAADDYRLIDDISSGFNGSTTSFALQVAGSAPVPFPKSPQQVLISVNGVIQEPDPTGASGFNLVGTNIVFSSAPTNGHAFFGIIYATADYLNSGGNFPSGSLGAPSITFVGDEDTGIYRKGSGSVAFVADSTEIANTDSNGITISSGNLIIPDSIIHSGDSNTKIRFSANDRVTIETGGSERLRVQDDKVMISVDFKPDTDSARDLGTNTNRFANGYFDTLYGDGSNLTGITQTTITNQDAADRILTTTSTANTINGEDKLTWDGTNGLLSVKHGYSGGGGTGLLLFDTTSTGGSEGMNIEWRSGTDKTADQCRIGQFSNATGSGSNLDFYTNHQDTGSSTRRLRIDQKGNLVTGNVTSPTSSDTGNIYVKPGSSIGSAGVGGLNIAANAVFNGSWKAIATGATGIFTIANDGGLQYRTDTSSSAGADFSLDRRFAIAQNGRTLLANDTSATANANLTAALSRVQITGPASVTAYTLANSYLHLGGTESTANHLYAMSFGHMKTAGTHSPAYIGLRTVDTASYEDGQIEIATRDVTTDTLPTPSLIVRPSKAVVRRGPDYANYVVSMKTINGGSSLHNVQVFEDCYGQWLVVAKISSTDEFKGIMDSTGTLDTTNNQVTGNPSWSCLFGDTYPSEVRYISASDWEYWRETRIIDFVHGVPNDRKWKNFFLNGQSSGMPIVANSKRGWTCAGCYDGFGRWRNPLFINHKMSDNMTSDPSQNPIITEGFFTTSGQTMNWYNGAADAKFIASHDEETDGQDDNWTTGWGWDDAGLIRSDEFPSKGNNSSGTDLADYNLWVLIKLGSPTFGHDG